METETGAANRILIRGASRIVTPIEEMTSAAIIIEGGRIAWLGPAVQLRELEVDRVLDVGGLVVLPGFIDLHVHGGGGYEVIEGTTESLLGVAQAHARFGTTAFLATTASFPWPEILATARAVRRMTDRDLAGAQILGLHLEGPFINEQRRGAHPRDFLLAPTSTLLAEIERDAGEALRMVAVAPELWPADLLQSLAEQNVVVALGHSMASYEEARRAIEAGASHAIHTFNATVPFHHRHPGLIGAVLTSDEVTAEVIPDGVHVHPAAIRLLLRCKGMNRTVLVTDATSAAGLPDGVYKVLGQTTTVSERSVRLADGTLAGSVLTMNQAVANMCRFAGIPLLQAVAMATLNPARVVKVQSRKGTLRVGMDADLIAVDEDLNVHLTLVGGRIVYQSADCRIRVTCNT